MHFVLVPGAWHAGWVWQPVARRLRSAGHSAQTLTLPGLGDGEALAGVHLDDAVDHIVEAARQQQAPITLVAHSLGGLMASAAAGLLGDRVDRLVFVDAFVPTPGQAMNDNNPPEAQDYLQAVVAASEDHSVGVPDLEVVHAALMHESPQPMARMVRELLTPTPAAYFLEPYLGPDVAEMPIPMDYILAADDRGLPVPGEQFAATLGVTPIRVPGNHQALITHPDEVAGALSLPV